MDRGTPGSTILWVIVAATAGLWLAFARMMRAYLRWRGVLTRRTASDVYLFGAYSPVLTWLRNPHRSLPDLQSELSFIRAFVALNLARLAGWWRSLAARIAQALVRRRALYLTAVIGLAVLPPLLVMQHRWLWDSRLADGWWPAWCAVDFFCQTNLPTYFLWVLLVIALLAMLVLLQSDHWRAALAVHLHPPPEPAAAAPVGAEQLRLSGFFLVMGGALCLFSFWLTAGRAPGWVYALGLLAYAVGWLLREIPFERVTLAWKRNGRWIVALALLHLAWLLFLRSYYSAQGEAWLFALLLAAASAHTVRYARAVPLALWIATLALVLFTLQLDAWYFSVVGDEFSFYFFASNFIRDRNWATLNNRLFDGQGVFGSHPVASSVVHIAFMLLFGRDNFGWRLSNPWLSAAALPFFYFFFRTFASRRVAFLATFLLAASHYLMSFGKMGNNNLQALWSLALVLAAAAWAVRSRTRLAYVMVGLALAGCFYSYPAALHVLPVAALLLIMFDPPTSRAGWVRRGWMSASLLLVVLPLVIQPAYWTSKIAGTWLYNPTINQVQGGLEQHFVTNVFYALLSFVYIPSESHFVAASFVDPLTGMMALLGILGLVCLALWQERWALYLMLSYASLIFLVGASHDRPTPPATRMFLLLPWWALFAAFGLAGLLQFARNSGLRTWPARRYLALFLGVVLGLNLYQAYELSPQRSVALQWYEELFLRLAQRAQALWPGRPMSYVVLTEQGRGVEGLQLLKELYTASFHQATIDAVPIDRPALPAAAQRLVRRGAVVLVRPTLRAEWQEALSFPLSGMGLHACDLRDALGAPRMTLWHAPELAALCQ